MVNPNLLPLLIQDQWCALLCAAKEGHADVCIELLDNGADIEHKDMVRMVYSHVAYFLLD